MRTFVLATLLLGCGGSSEQNPTEERGCGDAVLLPRPADFAARGPWDVGARTETIAGGLRVEVWYPAAAGSVAGKEAARYDIRAALPASEAAKIPDADNPWQSCDCYRDLPVDAAGPFPVVLFVHGTASFRHQSLSIVTHWASRGFVVVAADHPGLRLGDVLGQACGTAPPAQNLAADLDTVLAAIGPTSPELAFLDGHVDLAHLGVAGHSAGANAAAAAAVRPNVLVAIGMAGSMGVPTGPATMFLAGTNDGVVAFNRTKMAYEASVSPSYFVGLQDAGHLAFSDLCETKNEAGKDLLQIARDKGVCGAQFAGVLFDCDPANLSGDKAWRITNYATTAVLEKELQCRDDATPAGVKAMFPEVAQFESR